MPGFFKTSPEFTLCPITVCSFEDMSQIWEIILNRICEEDRWKNPITACLPCIYVWRSVHLVNECQKALLYIGDAVGWFQHACINTRRAVNVNRKEKRILFIFMLHFRWKPSKTPSPGKKTLNVKYDSDWIYSICVFLRFCVCVCVCIWIQLRKYKRGDVDYD